MTRSNELGLYAEIVGTVKRRSSQENLSEEH